MQQVRKEEKKQWKWMKKPMVLSGATPPWGAPDQGWGKGNRPAITMSHHAAETYCRWLTQCNRK